MNSTTVASASMVLYNRGMDRLRKRIQFKRDVTWDQFGEAWSTRPTKDSDRRIDMLRVFNVMILRLK